MKIRCEVCGNKYNEFLDCCPYCSSPNQPHHDDYEEVRTIEQLKRWYKDRNLPPQEITRFFIGVDYNEPKAFGIYKTENGAYVVYKNKADGTRVIRYEGYDEATAVYELHQKLKDEILNQKRMNAQRASSDSSDSNPDYSGDPYSIKNWSKEPLDDKTIMNRTFAVLFGFVIIIMIITCLAGGYSGGVSRSGYRTNNGYYDNYNNNHYSNSHSSYDWSSSDSWNSGGTDWNSDW